LCVTSSVTYSTNYYQGITLEGWFTNLEQTPLNRYQQLPNQKKVQWKVENLDTRNNIFPLTALTKRAQSKFLPGHQKENW